MRYVKVGHSSGMFKPGLACSDAQDCGKHAAERALRNLRNFDPKLILVFCADPFAVNDPNRQQYFDSFLRGIRAAAHKPRRTVQPTIIGGTVATTTLNGSKDDYLVIAIGSPLVRKIIAKALPAAQMEDLSSFLDQAAALGPLPANGEGRCSPDIIFACMPSLAMRGDDLQDTAGDVVKAIRSRLGQEQPVYGAATTARGAIECQGDRSLQFLNGRVHDDSVVVATVWWDLAFRVSNRWGFEDPRHPTYYIAEVESPPSGWVRIKPYSPEQADGTDLDADPLVFHTRDMNFGTNRALQVIERDPADPFRLRFAPGLVEFQGLSRIEHSDESLRHGIDRCGADLLAGRSLMPSFVLLASCRGRMRMLSQARPREEIDWLRESIQRRGKDNEWIAPMAGAYGAAEIGVARGHPSDSSGTLVARHFSVTALAIYDCPSESASRRLEARWRDSVREMRKSLLSSTTPGVDLRERLQGAVEVIGDAVGCRLVQIFLRTDLDPRQWDPEAPIEKMGKLDLVLAAATPGYLHAARSLPEPVGYNIKADRERLTVEAYLSEGVRSRNYSQLPRDTGKYFNLFQQVYDDSDISAVYAVALTTGNPGNDKPLGVLVMTDPTWPMSLPLLPMELEDGIGRFAAEELGQALAHVIQTGLDLQQESKRRGETPDALMEMLSITRRDAQRGQARFEEMLGFILSRFGGLVRADWAGWARTDTTEKPQLVCLRENEPVAHRKAFQKRAVRILELWNPIIAVGLPVKLDQNEQLAPHATESLRRQCESWHRELLLKDAQAPAATFPQEAIIPMIGVPLADVHGIVKGAVYFMRQEQDRPFTDTDMKTALAAARFYVPANMVLETQLLFDVIHATFHDRDIIRSQIWEWREQPDKARLTEKTLNALSDSIERTCEMFALAGEIKSIPDTHPRTLRALWSRLNTDSTDRVQWTPGLEDWRDRAVVGDPADLQLVIRELANNARHHGGGVKSITLTLAPRPGMPGSVGPAVFIENESSDSFIDPQTVDLVKNKVAIMDFAPLRRAGRKKKGGGQGLIVIETLLQRNKTSLTLVKLDGGQSVSMGFFLHPADS